MKKTVDKIIPYCFLIGVIVYVLGIIVFNYNGKAFYDFDMNADANIAKMMAEQKTFFPNEFVFGNQFYIVATPALSALLYFFIKDSFLSLATASCLMMFFSILSFLYCFDYKANKKTTIYGLFCLIGGAVVGSGACSYINGLQVFYTMASYYSCYLIGILLTFGVYLRLKKDKHCNKIWIFLVLAYNFALNMHSLRQMLVCCIPILCFESASLFFAFIKGEHIADILKNNRKNIIFVMLVMLSAIGGIVLIKNLDTLSAPIIEEVKFEFKPYEIYLNAKETLWEFCYYIGIFYYQKGTKYFILTFFVLFLIAVVLSALIMMIKKQEQGTAASIAYFSAISLFGVFFVGTFLMKVRSIYFFVWYLLIASCVVYLCNELRGKLKYIFLSMLLIVGAGNFVFNFGLDTIDYINKNSAYEQLADNLKDMGIRCIYTVDSIPHKVAIYSNDEIELATLDTDYKKKSGYPLIPITYLQKQDAFYSIDYDSSVLMLNDTFWDLAERKADKEYIQHLTTSLELTFSYEIEDECVLYFYKIKKPVFAQDILG